MSRQARTRRRIRAPGPGLIGLVGYGIEMVMRRLERWLIPWKGKG